MGLVEHRAFQRGPLSLDVAQAQLKQVEVGVFLAIKIPKKTNRAFDRDPSLRKRIPPAIFHYACDSNTFQPTGQFALSCSMQAFRLRENSCLTSLWWPKTLSLRSLAPIEWRIQRRLLSATLLVRPANSSPWTLNLSRCRVLGSICRQQGWSGCRWFAPADGPAIQTRHHTPESFSPWHLGTSRQYGVSK